MNFHDQLNRAIPSLRLRFEGLSDEKKQAVVCAFYRHRKACEKCGTPIDPQFLVEAISEAATGRIRT